MDFDIQNLIDTVSTALMAFFNSPFILVVKIFAGLYIAILIVNIILLLILRDVPSNLRVGLKGMDIPITSKKKMRKRWDKMKERLRTGNISQYKVAIIEADAITDEILGGIGYSGSNMAEKLEQVGPGHLDGHLEDLQGVHKIRNRIIHEANFEIDEKMAKATIGVYESFLKYLEFLE